MFRVLIVDDDKLIVDDLTSLLDWNALDCSLPDSATNGRQALSLLQAESYDIVLTDISMPIMDGVELIRKAKEQNVAAVFLVISNYDDFVLVKEAMKHGAVEYLLKYEITAESLAQQIQYAQDIHKKNNLSLPRREDVLNQQKLKIRKLYRQETKDYAIKLPVTSGVWVPITLILFGKNSNDQIERITQIAEQALHESECAISVLSGVGDNKLLLLLSIENPSYLLSLRIVMNYLQALLSQARSESLLIAASIGRFCHEELELGAYIFNLKDQDQHYFYLKPYGVIQNHQSKVQSEVSFDFSVWTGICRNMVPNEAVNKLMEFFQANWVAKDRVKSNCAKLIASIVSTQETDTSVAEIWAANTAWDISKILLRFLEEQSLVAVNSQGSVRMEIRKVLKYIAENYGKQISLSDLADTACLSPNYFCRIFKSETGLNYTEYLSKYRLEQAKRLLRSTTLRTHEIAEQVGFRDYRYFCRIFKDATGLTCSEFRREYGENR
ncbi:MAG: helix-turn-helix domain-containing protein [Oscillospiraceae bacterium]|nr:helix-turn-helix domain-containing protein [Oscillospiraceae bacterium]